ncbi:hypothetical protein ACOBR2_06325 [Telmatobacter bradus]|uniref:hypothetical protein n=1 Tax=Telmatobacter bradus TaxID=474953 RepID=UPI003B430BD9
MNRWNWPSWLPHLILTSRKCPCCNSAQFKAAEMRPIDEIFRMFVLRPIRCMFCWRRYYWFALHDPK